MRQDLMRAAAEIAAEQGARAVSIRAIAARAGVSPMTTYRYFADKTELFDGIWETVFRQMDIELRAAVATTPGNARARLRAYVDRFLRFWQGRPDDYALLYGFSEVSAANVEHAQVLGGSTYAAIREHQARITQEFADEIGAGHRHLKAATDVRFAMVLGFLHGTMVVTRYDWTETASLQPLYVDTVVSAVEKVLREGPPTRPAG
jgi:AcrR family transcriptional regulator